MAYLSLYRRYRPQTFADVVGQGHVTQTLSNAISEDRLHHAYLFTGPRGTGKTSTARILAKAINCEQGPSPTPCNTCSMCEEITQGSSVDVIELDMASHGGVDDARELRERALFGPARARLKVYILDEVHMASTAAFNALLKLVEEPPQHVVFAMATTDPQKVLPTIMSRVQRLDLRRVSAEDVAAHVRHVADAEGATIADDAIDAIVRAGDGSVRDTLSVLEQVLAFAGNVVDGPAVAQVIGSTPHDRTATVVDGIIAGDVAGLLVAVQRLVDDGLDLRRFTIDLAQHVRDLLALAVAPERNDLVDATAARRIQLATQAAALSPDRLIAIVGTLAATVAEQRQQSPRLALELALATLAAGSSERGSAEPTTAAVAPDEPVVAPSAEPAPAPLPTPAAASEPAPAAASEPEPDPDPVPVPDTASASAETAVAAHGSNPGDPFEVVVEHWEAILETLKTQSRRCHAMYEPAKPIRAGDGILTLRYGKRYVSFHAAQALKQEFSVALLAAVEQHTGQRLKLEVVKDGDDDRRRPRPASVTPDDARTPVFDERPSSVDDSEPPDEEVAAVREAERDGPTAVVDIDALLAEELGAARIDDPDTRA